MGPAWRRRNDQHQREQGQDGEIVMLGDARRATAETSDAAVPSPSSINRLLRWLKKSIGIKCVTKNEGGKGPLHQRGRRTISFAVQTEDERTDVTSSSHSHDRMDDRKHHATECGTSHVRVLECPPSMFPRSIYNYPQATPVLHNSKPDLPPHVLIIGGGISGLCLAQGFKKLGIRFTVFEKDPSPNFATQAYRIQINTMGYESLKAVLARDKFDLFLRSAGEIFPKTTSRDAHTGRVLTGKSTVSDMAKSEATRQVFSVNHSMLRSLLLSDLEEGVEIKYGMSFKRFHVLPNGVVEVHFDNGRFTHGTMLAGADGTASRVRQQYLSRHVKVLDTDCGVVYGKTPLTTDLQLLGLASDTTTVVTSQSSRMTLIIDPQSTSSVDLGTREAREHPRGLRDQNDYVSWVLLARLDKVSPTVESVQWKP